jgi:hypothetical protein
MGGFAFTPIDQDECRQIKVTARVAQNQARPGGSAIDSLTTRNAAYAMSQRKRKRIEKCFGWLIVSRFLCFTHRPGWSFLR